MTSKTIIVSNRLPVRLVKEKDELSFIPSEGGLATGLGSIYKQGENVWIGWPGAVLESKAQKENTTNRTQRSEYGRGFSD